MTTMSPVMNPPLITPPTNEFWQGFVSTAKEIGNTIWSGIQDVARWAAGFFAKLGAIIVSFAQAHSRDLIICSVSAAIGILIAVIFSRCCSNQEEEFVPVNHATLPTAHPVRN